MQSTVLHIATICALLACAGPQQDRVPAAAFRVALLTPGPITDQSWNAGAYAGLLRIRDSLGAEVSHIQTKTPAEFEENFREYGRQGYALVIGHGFEFQDAAVRVASAFPGTQFLVTSSAVKSPNVAGIHFAFEEPSYAAGVVAGSLTKTGVIGGIGGTELPPVKAGFAAFAAGARSVNPAVRMLTVYVGNWDDATAGKEQAHALMAQGADIIFQNADAAGLGVFQAARETHSALVFGSNADQNSVAPDVILGSVVIDLPHAFLTVARMVRAGTAKSGIFELGTASGAVRLAFNSVLADRVPLSVQRMADSVLGEFRSGRRKIP